MRYPAFNEYQEAIQNPSHCFDSADLQQCSVEKDLWGLPRVRSGGFALTYKMMQDSTAYAVRCFHRHVEDRSDRYRYIHQFLSRNRPDFLEDISYFRKGIQIKGIWYPITCMKWVEGETLEAYIIQHLNDSVRLTELLNQFQQMVFTLEEIGVAHGDLSHHNLIVHQDQLYLVDYDGMYVPGMPHPRSCEIGNPNFQHPARDLFQFGPDTDRFSSIVIYLAIKSIAFDPRFWYRFETGGEGLLFVRSDFTDPYRSPLLQEMDSVAALQKEVAYFRQICQSDGLSTPRLEDFIAGHLPAPMPAKVIKSTEIPNQTAAPLLDGQRKYLMNSHLGEVVSIIGKIEDTFLGKTLDQVPHIFLNMGDWRSKCFTIVLWGDALGMMENAGRLPEDYIGHWVKVTGLLTMVRRRPQIVINTPFDIEVIHEDFALEILRSSGSHWNPKEIKEAKQKITLVSDPSYASPVIVPAAPDQRERIQTQENDDSQSKTSQTPNPLDIPDAMRGAINNLFGDIPKKSG